MKHLFEKSACPISEIIHRTHNVTEKISLSKILFILWNKFSLSLESEFQPFFFYLCYYIIFVFLFVSFI